MPDISFHISTSLDELKAYAELIRQNKLHYSRDSNIKQFTNRIKTLDRYLKFSWTKNYIRYSRPEFIIALICIDKQAIACFCLSSFNSSFYVKREYRRKGIAALLFKLSSLYYPLSMKVKNIGFTLAAVALKRKLGLRSF